MTELNNLFSLILTLIILIFLLMLNINYEYETVSTNSILTSFNNI